MKISFSKYQGTGNDFIIIDNRAESFPTDSQLISSICDRRFGVGADGLILIQTHEEVNYTMVYFNADGSKSLCGNGSRCAFVFAKSIGLIDNHGYFEASDGIHEIKYEKDLVHLQLKETSQPRQLNDTDWYLDTGSPHHIRFCSSVDDIDLIKDGREVRYSDAYISQNGTNFNVVQKLPTGLQMRTYERGVENETLSCGTGATAVGLAGASLGMQSPIAIKTRGGELSIQFNKTATGFSDIWLIGPAEKVFEGFLNA